MPITYGDLTPEDVQRLGEELDAIRNRVVSQLGQEDVDYIRNIIKAQRGLEMAGRGMLEFGWLPPLWLGGVAALSLSKILDNMEIGHNVMHGQYDWTRDPKLDSRTYEWDTACPGDDWRHSHNYEHHTFTNVLGRDRDVGYGFLRVTPEQRWRASHLTQPVTATLLAVFFQWGVGTHDLRLAETLAGKQSTDELRTRARPFLRKAAWQLGKDYVFFPALALWNAPRVALGNMLANLTRNLWSFAIIFCGHFPDGVRVYREEETLEESRGEWYARQLNGSANIEGGRILHVLSGHLSHQIEHHLFPDLPAARYPEIAPKVREICERYGQAYNTGSFAKQLGSVARSILTNALPTPAMA
jgi:linoleoyl-CoA desaturase